MVQPPVVEEIGSSFSCWSGLLSVLQAAFEAQRDRIDPPSSVYELDPDRLRAKAAEEHVFVAKLDGALVGCVFARPAGDSIYLGKLAVLPALQGKGLGRTLIHCVEDHARRHGSRLLELETRIELDDNHRFFAACGFHKVGEHAHAGYDRPTFISMQKRLSGS